MLGIANFWDSIAFLPIGRKAKIVRVYTGGKNSKQFDTQICL